MSDKDLNRFDFGIHIGVGAQMLKNIHAELRYSFGLSDMDKTKDIGDYNNSLGLVVGYVF